MLLQIKYCELLTVLTFTTHAFLYGRVYVLILLRSLQMSLAGVCPGESRPFIVTGR